MVLRTAATRWAHSAARTAQRDVGTGLVFEKFARRTLGDGDRFLRHRSSSQLFRSAMVFIPLFFALSVAHLGRHHHRGGVGHRGGGRLRGPGRGRGPHSDSFIRFLPRSVPANTPFTLAFKASWTVPFNITIGQNTTLAGYVDHNRVPQVDVPPMQPGRKKLVAGFDDGTTKLVGFLTVEKRVPWKTAAAVGLAIVLTLGGVIFFLFKNMNKGRKKDKLSDLDPSR